MPAFYQARFAAFEALALLLVATAGAQSAGNSGSINGAVVDSTGAVVPKAGSSFATRSADLTG
jgi:hypothetical protein